MKIAAPNDNGKINQHFGQSKEFIVCEMDGQNVAGQKIISAESLQHNHGGLAKLLQDEGVEVVILGGIGPYALEALEQTGFKTVTGVAGDVREAMAAYARGELVSQRVVCNHHGHDHGGHGHGHDHCH
jgi:predicted Fe-Mo cluster-binding NifX family protein